MYRGLWINITTSLPNIIKPIVYWTLVSQSLISVYDQMLQIFYHGSAIVGRILSRSSCAPVFLPHSLVVFLILHFHIRSRHKHPRATGADSRGRRNYTSL